MTKDPNSNPPVLVSACLLGRCCRYDGGSRPRELLLQLENTTSVVAVCPEQLGGLPTPRAAADITGGDGGAVLSGNERVVDRNGEDRSVPFIRGAQEVLTLARRWGCRLAILKERSPSCGVREIVRDGKAIPGSGVCATLLRDEGLAVISDEDPDLERVLRERNET